MNKLLKEVLKQIKPTRAELEKDRKIAEELIEEIKKIEGSHIEVQLAGSVARETHLRGDKDIDLFVLFPKKMSRKEFEREGLRIGKKVFRNKEFEEAYSEHPYIRGKLKGFDVEIVPSYKIKSTKELQSAVDRTPFHNKYLLEKLSEKQKDEVRLLRQFLKGIKCYGADIRVSSVPGYVTELLILKYGTFEKTIKEVAKWKHGTVIDLENFYNEKQAREKFNSHFIVVDPTDKNRNVAAALSFTQFSRFVAAARAFLENPSKKFFFGAKTKPLSLKKVKEFLKEKELVAIQMPYPKKGLSDVVWAQMKKLRKKLIHQLKCNDFRINRGDEWTDEKKEIFIVIDLENIRIQQAMVHVGPEVVDFENSKRFLEENKRIIAGPRIENGRWVVEKKRKYWNAETFLKDYLKKLKKLEKKPIKTSLRKAKVLEEKDLLKIYKTNKEFALFLTRFLKGKEEFLCY